MGKWKINVFSVMGVVGSMAKEFNTKFNVGKAKYVINYHDGIKKHKDGSNFFDIAIFSNLKKFNTFKANLIMTGYVQS
jgi:hypothetical protein